MKFDHLQKLKRVAVVGASSLLGKEVVSLLEEIEVSSDHLIKLSNPDEVIEPGFAEEGEPYPVVESTSFDEVDLVLFVSPTDVTRRFLPHAQQAGCLVWDFSGAFRSLEGVPMVVPGINETELLRYLGRVANGPCSGAVPIALALQPFLKNFGIKMAVISTYQPVSEMGNEGFEELSYQSAQMLNGADSEKEGQTHPLAFNCIPWIGDEPEGTSSEQESPEEQRLRHDVNRLLGASLSINVTAVRVPTFYGFGASVYLELETPFPTLEPVRDLLERSAGIKLFDKPESQIYPTNRECSGADPVFIGRLRQSPHHPAAICFWIMADNLRRGAALNAIEGLEYWLRTRNPAPVLMHPGSAQVH